MARVSTLSDKIVGTAQSVIRRHLRWIYGVTTTRPGAVFAACCVIFAISVLGITRIRFEADIFKMFPQKGPLALFLDTMQWTGGSGNAYFLLEGEKEKLLEEAEIFSDKLRALRVDGKPAFKQVKNRVFDPAEAGSLADFLSYAVTRPQLFVPPHDLQSYIGRLVPAVMERSLRRAKAELAAPGTLTGVVTADPLYLRDQILPRLKTSAESLSLDPSSPYFLSRDGKVLIIIGEPSRPVTDIAFARKLVAGIDAARSGSPVRISCAGAHLSAVTDEAVMKENVLVGVLSSLAIVLALFYVSYRRILPTLLIPVILCFGIVVAVAAGGVFYPSLSIISFAFASLIVGIGTDYTIHLYDRYHYERAREYTSEEALRLAVVDTGHALFTAATTTALPFLALVVSDVRALAELGLLVGLGVIFSLYATLFFLPPLLLFMDRRFPPKAYRPLPALGLRFVWRISSVRPSAAMTACGLAVLFFLASARGISFESDLKNLQPKNSEAFLAQDKLEKHLSITPKEMIVAVEGEDLSDVMIRGSKIAELAERYKREGQLVAYSSLTNVLNDDTARNEVIRLLASSPTVAGVGAAIEGALLNEGFAIAPVAQYVAQLSALSHAPRVPVSEGVTRLGASPFRGILDRHLAHAGGQYHLLTYLNYRGKEFSQASFLSDMRDAVQGVRATSVDLISRQLIDSVRQSFAWAVAIGSVTVVFLLVSHFNSIIGILCSLVPVTSGVIAMIGVMSLAGMSLNFMNVMVLVTILGMGSDYGLHVAHRMRDCDYVELEERFVQSGRAVLLSALTTIAGFGSLAFTDYGAMASIGWATNFGVAATTVFALATVPALVVMKSRRRSCGGGS